MEFRLKVELDPQPEDREVLEKWPRALLMPDLATLASGWVAVELGGQPIMHEGGRHVSAVGRAVSGDPLTSEPARIGDYVLIFLQRLLDATRRLGDGHMHRVDFGDNPAFLELQKDDGKVRVRYEEEGHSAEGLPTERDFLATVKTAVAHYLEEIYTVNGALREHPDLAALRDALRTL